MRRRPCSAIVVLLLLAATAHAAENDLPQQALAAMQKATAYFTKTVACNGGYLWRYSSDLKKREGEGKARATQVWVQPPGTPAVGLAFVRAYQATGDRQFLDAAIAAARCLVWGQLKSGGWGYHICFDPRYSRRYAYRRPKPGLPTGQADTSTLDDNTTQAALRLLMAVDGLLESTGKGTEFSEPLVYGLNALLKAQLPKGGWPQRFFLTPPKQQRYRTTVRINDDGTRTTITRPAYYAHYYTYNDNTINDCISVLIEAHGRYNDEKYAQGIRKAGDFIIASQLKPPQAGWAQQYTPDLKPEWARRFEPAAVCGAVTYRNILALIVIWLATGDEKYLKPIPAALEWLDRSRLPGDQPRWARFYELGTNRPLYFTKSKYDLTYKPDNMPTHYSFITKGDVHGRAKARYLEARKLGRDALLARRNRQPTRTEHAATAKSLAPKVARIIADLDAQSRWLTKGRIECRTFIRNLDALSAYVKASRRAKGPPPYRGW